MEISVAKTKDGLFLKGDLPSDIASSKSLEIFPLKEGAYLVVLGDFFEKECAKSIKPITYSLSDPEKDLIRKLLLIRFEKRLPQEVAKVFSKEENDLLERLVSKKIIQVFYGGKYEKSGVYNISSFAFNQARNIEPKQIQKPANLIEKSGRIESNPVHEGTKANKEDPLFKSESLTLSEHLEKFGFVVVENEFEARRFANSIQNLIKENEARGMRSFDKKYYFVKSSFIKSWEKKIESFLGNSEKTAEEIAGEIGIDKNGSYAILLYLCEEGEILEKRRGKFALA